MKVVRFLERKNVIRTFGVMLILAPFFNYALHAVIIKYQGQVAWSQFQFLSLLKQTTALSFFFALSSVIIGATLLSGSTKAWKFVLVLLGSHLLVQVFNINDKAWKGPMAWPSFLVNAGLFFFIFDQLVWKVYAPAPKVVNSEFKDEEVSYEEAVNNDSKNDEFANEEFAELARKEKYADLTNVELAEIIKFEKLQNRRVINLQSYRKIYFSFGQPRPWGELKTLSSELLSVKCISEPPADIQFKIVQINFAEDVVVDIQFDKRENDMVYFKPLNMSKEKVTNLNKWLNEIAI